MLSKLRDRLTFAHSISLLALFVALGGTSMAAVSLKRNSVKGKHIAANAITSPKVKDRSLRGRDFAAGQLPAGPAGPKGEQGERGDAGSDAHVIVTMAGPGLSEFQNNSTVSAANSWVDVPGRDVSFTKQHATSKLRVTYQDTLMTAGKLREGCQWRILLDGNEIAFFGNAASDLPSVVVQPDNAAHVAYANDQAAGPHTVKVQNRGFLGAWGSGTDGCVMGNSTIGSFVSVEELP